MGANHIHVQDNEECFHGYPGTRAIEVEDAKGLGKPESGAGCGGINACNKRRELSFPKTQGRSHGLEGPGQQESCKSPGLRNLFNVATGKGKVLEVLPGQCHHRT